MTEVGFVKGQSDNLPKLDSFMVAEFFANNPLFVAAEIRGVKANVSGRKSYGDSAVGFVQIKRYDSKCVVKAKICPEHKVRNKGYQISLVIDESKETVLSVTCHDCAASSGGCKHAIAFIMWVHRRSEEPSPTEVACYWKKARLAKVGTSLKYLTVADIKELPCPQLRNPSNGNFFQRFIETGSESNISSQIMKYYVSDDSSRSKLGIHQLLIQSVAETADDFLLFLREKMSLDDCKKACLETKDQSKNKLWYQLRYGRITASKIYEISHCKTPFGTLVEHLLGGLKFPETKAMRRGKILEEAVFLAVEEKTNINFHATGFFISLEKPFLGASPDGISDEFVLEIKCPSKVKTVSAYIKNNKITNKCRAQINLQMYLFGKKKGLFCIADPSFEVNKKVEIYEVELDVPFIEAIIKKAEFFWKQHIFPILLRSARNK